jgi:hypothetical protein
MAYHQNYYRSGELVRKKDSGAGENVSISPASCLLNLCYQKMNIFTNPDL